jgi:hypothetical protein
MAAGLFWVKLFAADYSIKPAFWAGFMRVDWIG